MTKPLVDRNVVVRRCMASTYSVLPSFTPGMFTRSPTCGDKDRE